MRAGLLTLTVAMALAGVSREVSLDAHRLDEYLQATRLMVSLDRVMLEMDLTPGVAVAPAIVKTIDTNGDGVLSEAEADAYATQVVTSLVMKLDGEPVQPRLDGRQMPGLNALHEGTGVIRLRASAALPRTRTGDHHLFLRNTHRSDIAAYLANALVPDDDRIGITGQRRDAVQQELTIDYRVSGLHTWPTSLAFPIGALAALGLAALALAHAKNSRATNQ